ncbi:hypothetical protein KIL84_015381 [Mauremys mutica]|uniref:Uncharacterized protein n=1 Tax=Mauremys mutica TaxID=74926 RepID=A0A9D3WMA8_9SAUR|nr:hypothetical protein KIL84_015381 [Mauremys mutica]
MKKGRSRGEKAGPPPPPRREPGRAAAAGGGRREPQDARAPGAACGEAKEKDVVTESTPLRCRKLSNPDIFSSTGKTKLHRQLSQDDCKLRRGSLASSLSAAQHVTNICNCKAEMQKFTSSRENSISKKQS